MRLFAPQDYPLAIAELVTGVELNELGPGQPNAGLRGALAKLDAGTIAGDGSMVDPEMAECCIAGLWLLHDFLDESHQVSQQIHSTSGSYWHGIMHRREPDYDNAKYWFRRVGEHPVFGPLAEAARSLASGAGQAADRLGMQEGWDPFLFVDLCRQAARGGPSAVVYKRIQRAEWELLFDHCYRRAVGH